MKVPLVSRFNERMMFHSLRVHMPVETAESMCRTSDRLLARSAESLIEVYECTVVGE
jgi:hypothetical protein